MVLNPKRSPPVKKALIKYIKARDNYRRALSGYLVRNSKPSTVVENKLERCNYFIYSYEDPYIGTVYANTYSYRKIKKGGLKASFIKVK